MEQVGVRDLKQNASRVLARVKAGETLEVTERGRPVAHLTPLPEVASHARLVEAGDLVLGAQDLLATDPVRVTGARVSRMNSPPCATTTGGSAALPRHERTHEAGRRGGPN